MPASSARAFLPGTRIRLSELPQAEPRFIKKMDCLAVDDVGSGYSGLKSIAEIKPDFIKIDMALIRDIDQHPIKQDLTGTIARFSTSSGITLIAEGVETVEELRCLQTIGVRFAQGFLFARPGPPFPRADLSVLED